MDLSEVFSSLATFWKTVAALVCIHLVLLGALYPVGFRPRVATRLRRFRDWAGRQPALEKLGLLTKLPYLVVLAVLFYFTIFNWAVQVTGSVAGTAGMGVDLDEVSIWQDTRPGVAVVEVAHATGERQPALDELVRLKYRLLDQFERREPDAYDSWVGWLDRSVDSALFLYHASLLIAAALVSAAVWAAVRLVRRRAAPRLRQIAGLLLLAAVVGAVCAPLARYRAEGVLAGRALNQFFVADELHFQRAGKPLPSQRPSGTRHERALMHHVNARLECRDYDPPVWLLPRLERGRFGRTLRRLFLARHSFPIDDEDRRVSGPYVYVFPREDDYFPGQRLCGFLRKKGLEAREVDYGLTVAAPGLADEGRAGRATLANLVREWMRRERGTTAYVCAELSEDGPVRCGTDLTPVEPPTVRRRVRRQ